MSPAGGDNTAMGDQDSVMPDGSMGKGMNAVGQDEKSVLAFDCSRFHC